MVKENKIFDLKVLNAEAKVLARSLKENGVYGVKFSMNKKNYPFYTKDSFKRNYSLYNYLIGERKNLKKSDINEWIDEANLGMITANLTSKACEDAIDDYEPMLTISIKDPITRIPDKLADIIKVNFPDAEVDFRIRLENKGILTYITPKLAGLNMDKVYIHNVDPSLFQNKANTEEGKKLIEILKKDDSTEALIKKMLENSEKQKQNNVVSIDKGKNTLSYYNNYKNGGSSSYNSSYKKKDEKEVKKKKKKKKFLFF